MEKDSVAAMPSGGRVCAMRKYRLIFELVSIRQPYLSSFRRRPESSMSLNSLDPGLRRDDVVSGTRVFLDGYQLCFHCAFDVSTSCVCIGFWSGSQLFTSSRVSTSRWSNEFDPTGLRGAKFIQPTDYFCISSVLSLSFLPAFSMVDSSPC